MAKSLVVLFHLYSSICRSNFDFCRFWFSYFVRYDFPCKDALLSLSLYAFSIFLASRLSWSIRANSTESLDLAFTSSSHILRWPEASLSSILKKRIRSFSSSFGTGMFSRHGYSCLCAQRLSQHQRSTLFGVMFVSSGWATTTGRGSSTPIRNKRRVILKQIQSTASSRIEPANQESASFGC